VSEPAKSVPLVVNEFNRYVCSVLGCCLGMRDNVRGWVSVDVPPLGSSFYVGREVIRGSTGDSDKSIVVREVQG
jgi:hypothetical protein